MLRKGALCVTGVCRLVVEQLGTDTLVHLMRCHSHLPKDIAMTLHSLYLFLMADQVCDSCPLTKAHSHG
jgi:hypothetical protein